MTLPPRHRCPLDRMPASRLLLPRSGQERSDFVRWHFCDMLAASSNVRVQEQSGSYVLLRSSSQFDPARMPADA